MIFDGINDNILKFNVNHNFADSNECNQVAEWLAELEEKQGENKRVTGYLKGIQETTKGFTAFYLYRDSEPLKDIRLSLQAEQPEVKEVPDFVHKIKKRVIDFWAYERMDEAFIQMVRFGRGGYVNKHYDPAPPGYVNCRANLYLCTGEDDHIIIEGNKIPLSSGDLLSFAPSVQKHWTNPYVPCGEQDERRLFCYGFLMSYADLGLDEENSRVRLSQKIWRRFVEDQITNHS